MAKPEWGTKRVCKDCGERFYDLEKSPIFCPACGTEYILVDQVEENQPEDEEEQDVLVTLDTETEDEDAPEIESDDDTTLLEEDDDDDVGVVIDADIGGDGEDTDA